jgi:hypothetical protein
MAHIPINSGSCPRDGPNDEQHAYGTVAPAGDVQHPQHRSRYECLGLVVHQGNAALLIGDDQRVRSHLNDRTEPRFHHLGRMLGLAQLPHHGVQLLHVSHTGVQGLLGLHGSIVLDTVKVSQIFRHNRFSPAPCDVLSMRVCRLVSSVCRPATECLAIDCYIK